MKIIFLMQRKMLVRFYHDSFSAVVHVEVILEIRCLNTGGLEE